MENKSIAHRLRKHKRKRSEFIGNNDSEDKTIHDNIRKSLSKKQEKAANKASKNFANVCIYANKCYFNFISVFCMRFCVFMIVYDCMLFYYVLLQ